jgi:hypothetical protein
MTIYYLDLHLQSDANFGRGDGIAGLIDQEVEHDASGFPYLRGRTLKGLLSEECDNIVAVLPAGMTDWNASLARLFGVAGSTSATAATWQIGDACLPDELRMAVNAMLMMSEPSFTAQDILASLTTVRRQTAMDPVAGTPDDGSLRAIRVVLRDLVFTSRFETPTANKVDVALLAAGCLALRRIGGGRNRGRGEVRCTLRDHTGADITAAAFATFARLVKETV